MFAERDWTINAFGMADASFGGGTLTVTTEADGMGSNFWWILSTFSLPAAGSAGFELVESPPQGSSGTFWVALGSSSMALSFSVLDGQLRTSVQEGMGSYVEQALGAYDPAQDLWLRLAYDSATTVVFAQTSPDGLIWSTFYEFDSTDFNYDDFSVDVGGGVNSAINGSTYTGVVASVSTIAVWS